MSVCTIASMDEVNNNNNIFDLKAVRLESTQRKIVGVGNIQFSVSNLSHSCHSTFNI
jgi:hypothetical protein